MVSKIQPLVIIPTYNEQANVGPIVESIQNNLHDTDILIVDDNSPDGTGDIASELTERDPRVFGLYRSRKGGLGTAYIAGFRWALERHYTHIFQIDADFSHDPAVLPVLLEATEHYDIALGSRWIPNSKIEGWSYHRLFLSRLANIYAQLLLRTNIHDLTGGYKCLRREVLETIELSKITSVGYGFQIEITWHAVQHGFTVTEIPITFSERTTGKSKLSSSTISEAFILVWRLRNKFGSQTL